MQQIQQTQQAQRQQYTAAQGRQREEGGELQRDGQWDRYPHSGYLGVATGKHPKISPTKQKRLLLNVIQNNSKNQIPIFIFSNKKRKFKNGIILLKE